MWIMYLLHEHTYIIHNTRNTYIPNIHTYTHTHTHTHRYESDTTVPIFVKDISDGLDGNG